MALGSFGRQVMGSPMHGDGVDLVAADPAGPRKAMAPNGSTTVGVAAHVMPFFGRGKRPGPVDPSKRRIWGLERMCGRDAPGSDFETLQAVCGLERRLRCRALLGFVENAEVSTSKAHDQHGSQHRARAEPERRSRFEHLGQRCGQDRGEGTASEPDEAVAG